MARAHRLSASLIWPQRRLPDRSRRSRPDPFFRATLGRGTSIRFPLKVKNYRELIGKRYIPRILIVVVVPKKVNDWLKQDEKSLILRRCGYWVSLAGEPES